jgi:hypothetical protein
MNSEEKRRKKRRPRLTLERLETNIRKGARAPAAAAAAAAAAAF